MRPGMPRKLNSRQLKTVAPMSAMGHKRTLIRGIGMSALPQKADMLRAIISFRGSP
jgi:hypothetical protein